MITSSPTSTAQYLALNLAMVVTHLSGPDNDERLTLKRVAVLLSEGYFDVAHEVACDAVRASQDSARMRAGRGPGDEVFLLAGVVALLISERE